MNRRRFARVWVALLVVFLQVTVAGPASAHAELAESSPANGSRVERAPAEISLTFTEHVDLIDGGLRLTSSNGGQVVTPEAKVRGNTVHWPMPKDLPVAAYVARWRVISLDSHPLAGAVSFGVGVDAGVAPEAKDVDTAPFPLVAARFLGYAGFAVFVGALAFLLWCWPRDRATHHSTGHNPPLNGAQPTTQRADERAAEGGGWPRGAGLLLTVGLLTALVASVLGLFLQGPYAAGRPLREVTDLSLLSSSVHTKFGFWMEMRISAYLVVIGVLWNDPRLGARATRWLAGAGAVALAATFSGTGHAASGSVWVRGVDTLHVLSAGIWVGGLVILAVTLREDGPVGDAVARFSRLALGLVLVLVGTGTLNAVIRLNEVADLWQSRYGRVLLVKLAVVAAALTAAAVSRRFAHEDRSPWRSVRVEAVATLVVLAVTSVLTTTAPPSGIASSTPGAAGPTRDATGPPGAPAGTEATVELDLGGDRTADLHVAGVRVGRSFLHLVLTDADGSPLKPNRVKLAVGLPGKDLGPFEVPLQKDPSGWVGGFTFPTAGTWRVGLAVEDKDLADTVRVGQVTIVK